MGTRSTIGFRSGNEVRYIYVASDGFNHGATLEKLGHYNCLNLWEQIGHAEQQGHKVYLTHFSDDDSVDWSWCKEQPNARTPIVATEKNWNKDFLEHNGDQLSGIIKVNTSWADKVKVSPHAMMDIINMEGTVWLYDLDNDKVFFMGDPGVVEELERTHELKDVWNREKAIVEF